MIVRDSFGFDPAQSCHHFLVNLRPGEVEISEHLTWDETTGSSQVTYGNGHDGQIRARLSRARWDAIAEAVRGQFNLRLRQERNKAGRWKAGPNLVRRELGKELVLLGWAIEEVSSDDLIATAVARWLGLEPAERWWLYTQTVAADGHGILGRGKGWRVSVRFAMTGETLLLKEAT